MKYNLLVSGNSKLAKDQFIFNLPPVVTCRGANKCKKFCYAKRSLRWKTVREANKFKLDASMKESFVEDIIKEIREKKVKVVRIHASGDFYSQIYLNKWFEIARICKDVKFYAFTKSLDLNFEHWLKPRNLTIIYSRGGKFDRYIKTSDNEAVVIDTEDERPKGFFLCPYHEENFKKCGISCNYCFNEEVKLKKVAFIKH